MNSRFLNQINMLVVWTATVQVNPYGGGTNNLFINQLLMVEVQTVSGVW